MLRLSETVTVPDGEYGEKAVQQIRLLTPGGYQLHQKGDDGEFRITDEGTTSLSEIPFSVAYSNRVGYLESRPPLEDIAELNLKYIRCSQTSTINCISQLRANAGILWLPISR
jgi:hypothetical protein